MNRIIVLLLFSTFSFTMLAQDCANPIPNAAYQSGFNQVASQPSNQKKLERGLELINGNCLTSTQVKNIAILFSEDSYRLEFCRAAFGATFDRVNFFEVYDAFTSFSNALRLYDYTRNPQAHVRPVPSDVAERTVPQTKESAVPRFADIAYPTPAKYLGNKGCAGPVMDGNNFNVFATQVALQPTDEAKYVAIEAATYDACYSMAQIMKLTSLIGSEKIRLRTLNETFPRTFDQDNFLAAKALFNNLDLQNQWVSAAKFTLAPPAPSAPPCEIDDNELKTVIKTLQSKNFPDDKLNLLSTINKSKCFTVAQVASLSNEFSFDKDKVAAMKMLYSTCPDKGNYYQLVDKIFIAHFQDELTQFIKNEGK